MPKRDQETVAARADPNNNRTFTDLWLKRLKLKDRQFLVWDAPGERGIGQVGLSVLVSPGGTKRFRATYYVNGKAVSKKLGRVGEQSLGRARELTAALRGMADEGKDPKEEERKERLKAAKEKAETFEAMVKRYIQEDARVYQRSWQSTEKILLKNCAGWLARPFGSITKSEARELLKRYVAEGHGYKASKTCAYIKRLWNWAQAEDHIETNTMHGLDIAFDQEPRRRLVPYSDEEVAAIWKAAETLSDKEEAFVKLLVLLAPRKNELAKMKLSHLDDAKAPTLWTTPHELGKHRKKPRKNPARKKRVYFTPLPKLAQRILKPHLPAVDGFIFESAVKNGVAIDVHGPLAKKLKRGGAPADFNYQCMRHTITTWLGNKGCDDFDQKLALNHTLLTGATASYGQHGYGLNRKRELLEKWADHVESLVTPKGVKALR